RDRRAGDRRRRGGRPPDPGGLSPGGCSGALSVGRRTAILMSERGVSLLGGVVITIGLRSGATGPDEPPDGRDLGRRPGAVMTETPPRDPVDPAAPSAVLDPHAGPFEQLLDDAVEAEIELHHEASYRAAERGLLRRAVRVAAGFTLVFIGILLLVLPGP